MEDWGFNTWLTGISTIPKILLIAVFALVAHVGVLLVRALSARVMVIATGKRMPKIRTFTTLLSSIAIFALYFTAFGLILREFGVSLTAYFASASVLGLAIGFGSQGIVQDVVTGITIIFSDLFDVGEMVEISGQTGIVKTISMRFTVLENPLGAKVFIPNRTITNVINYPRGYVRCLIDVTLPEDHQLSEGMESRLQEMINTTAEQFPGLLIYPPSKEGLFTTTAGKRYLRFKFRIWPGRGGPLESVFKQEIVQELKKLEPEFADWRVAINYEIEQKTTLV